MQVLQTFLMTASRLKNKTLNNKPNSYKTYMTVTERFLDYVKINSQSDPTTGTTPSTHIQYDFAQYLKTKLEEMNLEEITLDEKGYLMATLPANTDKPLPTIGFIAHLDTAPDMSGKEVKPRIVKDYDGSDIILNEEKEIVLSPAEFPELLNYTGQDIIVTDGTTLLGADDKAGIAEILTAIEYLQNHNEIKHGKIRIAFNPDEEIGEGAHNFDVKLFGCEFAFTMDGGAVGELEFENFNAAGAKITIKGRNVHPGTAKNKMINSVLIAAKLIEMLPEKETPAHTEGYEGFFHVTGIEGNVDQTTLSYIIRDFDRENFDQRKKKLEEVVAEINRLYPDCAVLEISDQYFNMREKIEPVMHIIELAERAMRDCGVTPKVQPIRGGTDGAQLSFKGLPCPNIFAGGENFHGRYEYVPIPSMEKAVEVIINICKLVAE